jgi:hypothetical protein
LGNLPAKLPLLCRQRKTNLTKTSRHIQVQNAIFPEAEAQFSFFFFCWNLAVKGA